VIHHSDTRFPSRILFNLAFHAEPCALMHAANLDLAVSLHLTVYFFLVVRDNVEPILKYAYCAKGTYMRLTVVVGGEEKSAAGLQIFYYFIHAKNSFLMLCCFFVCQLV